MRTRRDPRSAHPSFRRGPIVARRTNPKSGTGSSVSSDLVEPGIRIARSTRLKGEENDRAARILD